MVNLILPMIYQFDNYRLCTETHSLTRDGEAISIEPQTFSLLAALIANRDTVMTKDDLVDSVWQGRFASDASIAGRIKQARQAVGDDGKTQRYIKTLHGIGYRFVGPIESKTAATTTSALTSEEQIAPASHSDTRPMIVVRPFSDSFDGISNVIASGLTHDVIIGLSRIPWLKVISWASVMRMDDHSDELLQPLTNANYSLSGTLLRHDSKLELALQLVDLQDQSVIWAERVDASRDDVNELRTAVVQQVLNLLELKVSSVEAAKAQFNQTSDLDAWSNYHLGMLHVYRFNAADNARALEYFNKAIALQPEFSRAHAGLSFAQFQSVFNRYSSSNESEIRSGTIQSAERSLSLDATDPWANLVMGRALWLVDDIEAGMPFLDRALQINQNFAQGHYSRGLATILMDSPDDSAETGHASAQSAIAISPLDPFLYGFHGLRAFSFLNDGNLEEAKFWSNRAARQPNAIPMSDYIATAMNAIAGDTERASAWASRARERSGGSDSSYFFQFLPFYDGPMRSKLEQAFESVGLAPKR